MNRNSLFFIPLSLSLIMVYSGCEQSGEPSQAGQAAQFNTQTDSVSYSLGFIYGSNMAGEGISEFNYNNFIAGLRSAIEANEPQLSQSEMQMTVQNLQFQMQAERMAQLEEEAAPNRAEGEAYLAENAAREGVIETESGLQYRVLEEGTGNRPSVTSEVRVHYRGSLLSGEVFSNTYPTGEPVTFPLNEVISGWTEGVQLMREGARYEFYIPADLAYENSPPQGSPIPAGATLIFEIELLEVID